jgi:hypothetical protein
MVMIIPRHARDVADFSHRSGNITLSLSAAAHIFHAPESDFGRQAGRYMKRV